jgi:multidrug efflux system outer membrane protein
MAMRDAARSTRRVRVPLCLVAAVLLSACAVGPDYQRPATALEPGFVNVGAAAVNPQPVPDDIVTFWRGFNDPALDALMVRAMVSNGDVRIAQARLQESRALQGEIDAQSRPITGIDTAVTRAVEPITQQPGVSRSDRTGTTYEVGFIANWELDFFGRYRRGSEAAAARVEASEAGLGAAHTAVAAEVARNYLELRGRQQLQQVTEASLVNQREVLRITEARLAAGRGTQFDVERALALVASTEAALPALQAALERSVFRLATLTAQPPRALLEQLSLPAPLPGLPVTDLSTLPLGTPAQWLQRRPDVISAERQLAASTAEIGVATSDLFPRVSLSGLLGLNAASLGDLGKGASGIYSLGVGMTWTPLDYFGRIRSRIAATEARTQASLAIYEQTVAVALEETEAAFSGFNRNAQRVETLDRAVRSAEAASRLARLRYEVGVTDFLAVLDAEREALTSRDLFVQAQTTSATSLVAVYRALGGGWLVPSEAATVAVGASP